MSLSIRMVIARRFCVYLGEFGRGAGKSGGCGGTIRDAGGAFGRLEAANEEKYFFHLQEEQLKELKNHLEDEQTPKENVKISERDKLFRLAAEQRAKLLNTPQVE